MKTKQSVLISVGYGYSIIVPAPKAGALIAMLAECKIVERQYIPECKELGRPESTNVYSEQQEPRDMLLGEFDVMSHAEYRELRDAVDVAHNARGE